MINKHKAGKVKVSLGGRIVENLPFPIVYYPNHYGTFFVFSESEGSTTYFCECSRPAIENYVRLSTHKEKAKNVDPLRMAPLDNFHFPDLIAKDSLGNSGNLVSSLHFKAGLCHRCNLSPPEMTFCHPMYGGQFKQKYGWYMNQAFLRFGISPMSFDYLTDVCPDDHQSQIQEIRELTSGLYSKNELTEKLRTADSSERKDIFEENGKRNLAASQAKRKLTKAIENLVRDEFGLKKVGEGWVSETLLYQIVRHIYQNQEVLFHHRPQWLQGLEIDIFVPHLKLAFEYQGQQHYHVVSIWGGKKGLDELRQRDQRKRALCAQNGVRLIEIKYTEALSEGNVQALIKGSKLFNNVE